MAYQNFDIPIADQSQSGWAGFNSGLSGLTSGVADAIANQRQQQDAIRLLLLKSKAEEQAKFDMQQQRLAWAKKNYPELFGGQSLNPVKANGNSAGFQDAVKSAVGGQAKEPGSTPLSGDFNPVGRSMGGYEMNPNFILSGSGDMMVKNPVNELKLKEQQDQFDQRQWTALTNKFNPSVVSSRSALGMASNGNLRADRAMSTLQQPMVTNAQIGNVLADLAGIYQGGAPTQFGMHEQQYTTAYQQLQNLLQYVTAKPQNVVTPEIKKKVYDTIMDLKKVNNDYMAQTFKSVEGSQKKLISKYPEEWKALKESWLPPEVEGKKFGEGVDTNVPKYNPQTQKLQRNTRTGEYRVVSK